MDISAKDTTQQSINDDQELAKALAGVSNDPADSAPTAMPAPTTPSAPTTEEPMKFEETPAPAATPSPTQQPTGNSGDLDGIKKNALNELRPLIDKVDLPAEEKFDTYLMLIRSTDDASLIAPAHDAAQAISDEKRRAEALLDIIKEIDYLSHGSQPTA